tara:strand:+ start:278 stop:541 length:264 start_codon:yes stop_codon:yes gene_type:complete
MFFSKPVQHILPFDGETVYYGPVFSATESRDYDEKLLNEIPWKNDEAIVFRENRISPRGRLRGLGTAHTAIPILVSQSKRISGHQHC